jgi:electron transfer flavoprotein alpha/beta subunit
MKIVVCVKQVPEITDVKVDPETGTLIREGITSILNPFCEYALDHAVHLKSESPDIEIVAITMGPPQANRSAVPDFSLIMMGKQAIDGDTAQVAPEVAEILNLPQITYGVEVHWTPGKKRIRVKRETERGYEVLEARLPALVSAGKGDPIRRVPSFQDVLDARLKQLSVITAADLDLDETELGLKGSYTQVVKVFPPRQKQGGLKLEGIDPEVAARKIAAFLREEKFI